MRRVKGWTAHAAAALIAFYPLAASAQQTPDPTGANVHVIDRPHPEYEPLGIRLGAFIWRPSITAEAGATDNLFVEQSNTDSDTYGTIRVRAPIASDWSRHALRLDLGAERRMHVDLPKDDYSSGYAELSGRYDIAASTQVSARARAAREVEPRFSPESGSDVAKPIRFDVREGGLAASQLFNRLRLRGDVLWRELDYKDTPGMILPIVDQDVRDRQEMFASVRADYEMGPGWGLMAEARYNQRDFDAEPPIAFEDRDSEGQTYLVGATFDVTRLVRGQLAVGYLRQDYEDQALGWIEGVALDARVEWFPTELTSVTFAAARSVEETAYYGSGSYTLERVSVRVDHELYRNVVLTGAASAGRREFRGIDREDDVYTMDAGGAYRLNRNVSIRANWRFQSQDSSGLAADQDADVNELTLGVSFAM